MKPTTQVPFNYAAHRRAHDDADSAGAQGVRSRTLIVAASNSNELSRQQADYVCAGASDEATINQAISDLPSVGGSICFMEGNYSLDNGLTPGDNVLLVGQGDNTVIAAASGADLITPSGTCDNLELQSISFDPVAGMVLTGTFTKLRVVDCSVTPSDTDGGLIDNGSTVTGLEVVDCRFIGGGSSGVVSCLGDTLRIYNSAFSAMGRAFYFLGGSDWIISGCSFAGCTDVAILDNGADHVLIGGCHFDGNLQDIQPGATFRIIGNAFIGTLQESIVDGGTADNCIVVGNAFDACQVQTNNSKDTIKINGSSRWFVADNEMRYGSGNKPKYGIHIVSGTANEVIDNDLYHAGSTADYLDAGTTSVVEGNRLTAGIQGRTPLAGTFAPPDADYLVGTSNATLTNEIAVGTTPGGELGGTWANPTVDTVHSGSAHPNYATAYKFS